MEIDVESLSKQLHPLIHAAALKEAMNRYNQTLVISGKSGGQLSLFDEEMLIKSPIYRDMMEYVDIIPYAVKLIQTLTITKVKFQFEPDEHIAQNGVEPRVYIRLHGTTKFGIFFLGDDLGEAIMEILEFAHKDFIRHKSLKSKFVAVSVPNRSPRVVEDCWGASQPIIGALVAPMYSMVRDAVAKAEIHQAHKIKEIIQEGKQRRNHSTAVQIHQLLEKNPDFSFEDMQRTWNEFVTKQVMNS